MASKIIFAIIFGTFASFLSMALATPGTASFYTNYVPKACYSSISTGVPIATATDSLWQTGAACDKLFNVTCTGSTNRVPNPCTGRSVVVKVVNRCHGCSGTLDLSREAFSKIANPVAGIIKIDYDQIN